MKRYKSIVCYITCINSNFPPYPMVYIAEDDAYYPRDKAPEGKEILTISGTQFRKMLAEVTEVPPWFSFPEVIQKHFKKQ